MQQDIYKKKIACLEFANDQLVSELNYIDQLLRLIGFPEGIETIKSAAQEVMEEEDFTD